jgi:hypothetical protein
MVVAEPPRDSGGGGYECGEWSNEGDAGTSIIGIDGKEGWDTQAIHLPGSLRLETRLRKTLREVVGCREIGTESY